MSLKCCLHHLQSTFWASKTPPVNDPEDELHSSTASNSKTSMANSSEHPNDAGKKAAGTDASSSSDESSSSDDSEDGAGSAPTRACGKILAFQSRYGQGKQLRSVFPTANDSSEDLSNDHKDDAQSATTSACGKDLAFQSRLGQDKHYDECYLQPKIGPPSPHQEIFLNVFTLMRSLPMLVTNFQKTLMKYWWLPRVSQPM